MTNKEDIGRVMTNGGAIKKAVGGGIDMNADMTSVGRGWMIRTARPADAVQLLNILDVVGAEGKYIANDAASWTVADQRRMLEGMVDHAQRILVGDYLGAVVGSLEVVRGGLAKNAHTGTVAMAILPSYRGLGIGTGLLQEAHRWAAGVGIEKMCLSVFSSNEGAIRLYRKAGYQLEGIRVGQFLVQGELVDELLMACFLNR